ncbi:hypothetical protein GCM10009865_47690 [Aeromicrobium ponti]|uniref:Permuted papain-like amidase YaeF/Yiix C92 family enzyme n=1 Tax=Cytobacillus oceanisediminis TaxID=665099 RepID=A0A562JCU9_9BACI|nr:YiiX/YebB-like N1pC/P60 family cysteine hydrolase [Cytobacillus oceanisediminis]TWH80988.1 permuted papain-like amidase YaeF/Yiix C92 family enzyme [Cytobacillus oceanisediminis]
MQTGDIVFFRGQSWNSKIINRLTKSPYTHVGIAMSENMILEADRFIKTRIRPVTNDDIYIIMRCDLTWQQKELIYTNGKKFIGVSYDYLEIAEWFFKLLANYDGVGFVNNVNRVYCSELVDLVFKSAGVDLLPERVDGDVLPSHLMDSPLLTKV